MIDPADLPGPVPDPPSDFPDRPLAVVSLPADTILQRIHRQEHGIAGVMYYGPRTDPLERGRWDSPTDSFGVCYLAEAGHLAFAETFLRDLSRDEVSAHELGLRALAEARATRELTLVQMHGAGARRMRASGVVHASYDKTWAWARAIHDHPDAADGIRYRARLDDDAYAVALFHRAAGAVEVIGSTPLLDPTLSVALGGWLDRYDVALVP